MEREPAPGTRIIQSDQTSSLMMRRARLVVTQGPDAGKEIEIERTSPSVGTGIDNDLVLTDETVSARHFELIVGEVGVLLRDCGSRNGTFVNGLRVGSVYLNQTAEIVAGETRLEFSVLADDVAIPVSRRTNFGELLGHSAVMRAAFAVLERAAQSDATVLVIGESGTGKEVAARALHNGSRRSDGPYQVFDCGAASATLIESQLFGHARGAFTGAVEARAGVFEEASGGTLVLDEIGELPLELQPKLLRALEPRSVQRLGEAKARSVDVRFVACTHRNLEEEVRKGSFRQDLYYRLSVITVRLPPLRERKEELPRLLRHFLAKVGVDASRELPPTLAALIQSYDWPGNVRELRNFAERYAALHDLDPHELLRSGGETAARSEQQARADASALGSSFHDAKREWTERFEKDYLARLLALHRGNISEVARAAGISRQSCYRLMHKHGLSG